MNTEKKLHAIATSDAVVLAVSSAYEQAQSALANLSSAAAAADEAKRTLNDVEYWQTYRARNSSEEYELQMQMYLTLQHSATLALPSQLNAARAAGNVLRAAAKKLRGLKVEGALLEVLIDWYHASDELAGHIASEVERLKKRLTGLTDIAKDAFDKTFEHFTDDSKYGWPRLHCFTPWITVDSVLCHSAAIALAKATTTLEEGGRALRDMKDFRGNLDEESYGRRLERAKSKKQRDQLIAEQHARRLHLNHLRVGVEQAWERNSDMTDSLVEWANALAAAAKTDAAHAEPLRNNCLALVRVVTDLNQSRDWMNTETNNHRDLYAMVREVAKEAFTGEAA